MNAVELLEQIQSASYLHKGIDPEFVLKREIDSMLNTLIKKELPQDIKQTLLQEFQKQIQETISDLPTRYQSIGAYQIFKGIFDELETAIRKGNFSTEKSEYVKKERKSVSQKFVHVIKMIISSKYRRFNKFDSDLREIGQGYADKNGLEWKPIPVFGTTDIGKGFTAYITESATEPLIVLSEEIFPMASVISNIIAHCFPVENITESETIALTNENTEWVKHLDNQEIIKPLIRRFSDLMLSLLLYNCPGRTRLEGVYEYNTIYGVVASKIRHTIEKFIVCHEYCHYLLGHPGYQITSIDELLYPTDSPASAVKEMVRNHTCEWEADMYGTVVTILSDIVTASDEAEYSLSVNFNTLAIYSCFWIFEFLDRLANLNDGIESKKQRLSATHPAPQNRILRYKRDVVKSDIVYKLFGVDEDRFSSDELRIERAKVDNYTKNQFDNLDYAFDMLWNNFEKLLKTLIESVDGVAIINELKQVEYSSLQDFIYSYEP